MEDKQTNGQNINQERYCPNVFFDNGSISIGEFKTLDEAMNFPIQEIWCINRTEDNKYNSYRNQGARVLIICEWSKSIQDSRKFVVALVFNDGAIKYFDLNDLPIDAKSYEENLNNEALHAIYMVADENYRNNEKSNKL